VSVRAGYADGDIRRYLRCDTNGPVTTLPVGTRITVTVPGPLVAPVPVVSALVPPERLAVANTLGDAGQMAGWVREDGPTFNPTSKAIYRLGYAPGEWGMAADPVVTSTLIEYGNADALLGIRTPAPSAIPASYFLDRALPVREQ